MGVLRILSPIKVYSFQILSVTSHSFSTHRSDENEGFSMFLPSLEKALQVSRKYLKPTVQSSQCGLSELERAIQRRDPLGTGYHNREGLHLLSLLLKWNPNERISVRDALSHAYFVGNLLFHSFILSLSYWLIVTYFIQERM